jgi:hypothetical protein
MRVGLFFICLTLFSLSGAFAMQSKCNFCSEANADYYNEQLSGQIMPISFIDPSDRLLLASGEVSDDVQLPSVGGDKKVKSFQPLSNNIENILELINRTDNVKSFTDKNIDLLANFRNGDDVVVPLGFLLYINKKF